MNAIELTSEQRSKLIKMTKVLFKQDNVFITDQRGRYFPDQGPDILEFVCIFGDLGGIAFKSHWYEFCYEHLLSKLNLSAYRYIRFKNEVGKINIIDYCYFNFKNLKL